MESVWHDPVKPALFVHTHDLSPHEFADYPSGMLRMLELKDALCHWRKNKSADSQGVFLEMWCFAPNDLLNP